MAKTIQLDKDSILAQVARLADIAKKNEWEFDYDENIDTLVYGKKVIPTNSFLLSIDDELSIYLDEKSTINGYMIEYFTANYAEHNKDLQPAVKIITTKRSNRSIDTATLAEKAFQGDILQESLSALLKKKTLSTVV